MENIGAVFFSVHRWFFLPPRGGSTGIFVPYTEKELACSEICKPGRQRRRLFHTAGEICRSLPPTSFIRPVLGLARGGWALIGTAADPDITAMALQALVNYKDQSEVAAAAAVSARESEANTTDLLPDVWYGFILAVGT